MVVQDNITTVFYHLYLTDSCNLICKYCRGRMFDTPDISNDIVEIDETLPAEISWKFEDLYRFLARDRDAVLTFIGGEPTMRPDLITKIMNEAPVKRYMIQTNGLLLNRLSPDILNRFETILISIDGDQNTTDTGRGKGTYQRIIENIHYIIACGFSHEIIARMTVTEFTDIRSSVNFLSENADHSFSSIHWQIDANFWNDYTAREHFRRWVIDSYIPGIRLLAHDWISLMKRTGIVYRWYPFIDPVEDILRERNTGLRCGSGYENYTIQTDGIIIPCPIMLGMNEYYAGSITNSNPETLIKYSVKGRCLTCDIRTFCGGRCLYSSILMPWPDEGIDLVCSTVRALFEAIMEIIPDIRRLISDGHINLDQFKHEKYNGCEIIP